MAITDTIPWNRNRALATRPQDVIDPFNMSRRDINRVFGDFLSDWTRPDRMLNIARSPDGHEKREEHEEREGQHGANAGTDIVELVLLEFVVVAAGR